MNRFLRRWTKASLVATAIGTAAMAATAGALPAAPAGYNSQIDAARGAGSDTSYFQMQAFADLYNGSPGCKVPSTVADGRDFSECNDDVAGVITTENFDHDEIQNAAPFGVGSTNGLKQLCNATDGFSTQPVVWARSSRALKSTDCTGGATPVTQRGFARDGFTFMTFTSKNAYVVNGANEVTQGPPGLGCKPGQAPPTSVLTGLGFAGPAAGVTQPCNGMFSSSANRRLSDKNLKAIFAHSGGTVTDWCQLINGSVATGDSNDPLDTNPGYFPLCATPMPIEIWAVQTGSGTYGFFKDDILGGADPNAFKTQPASGTIQENDANPVAAAGASVMQRTIHWGSWGRFKAAPFTAQGGFFVPVGLAGAAGSAFIAPSIPTVGNTTGCTPSTCYLYARVIYNMVKANDTSGPGLAAKAFLEWMCKTTPHSINDDSGNNFDVDIKKIYDRFFIARLGGVSGTFGNCITNTVTNP